MNFYELDPERLATTAADGARVYLHPSAVNGKFRKWRDFVYSILLIIFLILPWVRVGGKPLLLLDLPHRHFTIFGVTFWGHDAPMLFLVFLIFVVTIGLITAVFGRGWCGWACPQTVFIDRVFLRIERWIDGDSAAQIKLDAAPWNAKKIFKRGLKWFLFLVASLIITHSFLAYFVGTDKVAEMIRHSPSENPASFLVILVTTAIILFDFGWFREQFCVIACPYGRLQSVLMDDHSLVIAYDKQRGEPRRQKGMDKSQHGDCVNCYRCVQVCPTGIDIRRGVQMECIACAACVDACDEVMEKIQKPLGLIRYDTEAALSQKKVKHVRARTLIYSGVLFLAFAILLFVLSSRDLLKVNFVHAKENPFQLVLGGKKVINHYQVAVRNQDVRDMGVEFVLPENSKKEGMTLLMPVSPLPIKAGESVRADIFITFPREFLKQSHPEALLILRRTFLDGETQDNLKHVPLVGPLEF